MRRIISRTNEEKKKRRNQLLIGGVLILVMVFSVLGYSFGNNENASSEKMIYNGHEFALESGFWATKIGELQFSFKYNPNETEKTSSVVNYLNSYSAKPLYLVSTGNTEAEAEIYRNLFYQTGIAERVQYSCLEGQRCEDENLPVKTCTDNTIIIKEGENREIKQQENCVFISGKKEDLTKLTDSFLYKIIGIQ